MMLSVSEVQEHLWDHVFHGLYKQLYNSVCYLYDDMRITYPQLMTATHKVSEQEDLPGEGVQARLAQSEGKDGIASWGDQMHSCEW